MEASRPFVGSSPAALKEALDVSEASSERHFYLPISSDKVRATLCSWRGELNLAPRWGLVPASAERAGGEPGGSEERAAPRREARHAARALPGWAARALAAPHPSPAARARLGLVAQGLCGGVNSSVVKATKALIAQSKDKGEASQLFIVGSKARDALTRDFSQLMVANVDEIYQKPFSWAQAAVLADEVLAHDFDKLSILYNKFYSVVRFEVTPLHIGVPGLLSSSGKLDEYEVDEEEDAEMLHDLYQFELASRLFNCVLENSTSENASRMTAMDNASKNASDMINKLQVVYNRQRQAVITTELNEIISGAESL